MSRMILRWAEPEDLPVIQIFLEQTFGTDSPQAVPGRCQWLFADNPEGLHICLGWDGRELVATCGHLPVTLRHGETRLAAVYGLDFMVRPSHRRQGIGRRFLDMRLQRFDISLSTGQSGGMAALYHQAEAHVVGHFQQAWYVRRPVWRGSFKELARDWVARSLTLGRTKVDGERRTLTMPAAAEQLQKFQNDPGIRETSTVWSRERFLWRFCGPVYRDYRAWQLNLGTGPSAVLVTRSTPETEVACGMWGPVTARADHLQLAGHTTSGASLTLTSCGPGLASDLKRAGYLVRPHSARMVAMTKDTAPVSPQSGSTMACYACESDTDLLRKPGPTI